MKINNRIKLAILSNGMDLEHLPWIEACEKRKNEIEYRLIDLSQEDWMEQVQESETDCFLARPPAQRASSKQMYDERLHTISQILKLPIYPTLEEILIYENKRMLSYWLKANQIPCPGTWIFYKKDQAMNFLNLNIFPIVAKTAIGASGSGVKILKNQNEYIQYITHAFSGKGISRTWGVNLRRGDLIKRAIKRLKNIPEFIKYMHHKKMTVTSEPQRWHVLLQEYIKSDYEWRCVRIGESFFGHKKLASKGEKKSGTSEVSWDPPPEKLLDFVKEVTEKGNFLCQAVDIFEDPNGNYLVNELQAFWGSKNPHQMIINGEPGRYILKDGKWTFEKGNFNTNNSYDLRIEHILEILKENKK
jgi:glutathione synthase/RimK-type ligase-like ATP-grasp enzyme